MALVDPGGHSNPAIANLDIKLQCSPTFYDNGVLMLGHAKCGTEGTSENAGDRRLGGLGLVMTFMTLGLADTEREAAYRSCHHRTIPTPDLHPSVFLRRFFLTFLNVIGGLGGRLRGNRSEERQ